MKKRNLLTLVLCLALVAALAVGGTLAYFTDSDKVQNTFTMGHVDINLDESNSEDEDGNPIWDENGLDYTNVVPGDTQKKVARLTVGSTSEDCYLMVNVALTKNDTDKTLLSPDNSKFTQDNIKALYDAIKVAIAANGVAKWKVTDNADGTLRCVYVGKVGATEQEQNHIAHKDDVLMLFQEIEIPTSFGNNVADQQFCIELNAFAIQSDNNPYNDDIWTSTTFEKYEAPAANPAPEA